MLTSYHVHSTFSDGRNTVSELVEAAITAGLEEIGISDHYVLLPGRPQLSWSMPLDNLDRYFETIRAASDETREKIVVRYGLEAEYDAASVSELEDVLRPYPFDYLIGAVHIVDGFPVDESKEHWDNITESERNDVIRAYWDRITRMAQSRAFDFAAHLDLYKKFGYRPTVDISADIAPALDAIAASGMAVELNTSGWTKAGEVYPSPAILAECRRRSIPMLINADAHSSPHLTRDYDRAQRLLRDTGYTQRALYQARKMRMAAL